MFINVTVSLRFRHCLFIFLLLNLFEIAQQVYAIKGPTHINGFIGEDASFMWNTTDQREIRTVIWGIRKDNIPDPQFISVNSYNGKVNINKDIGDTLKKRVEFIGNLTMGRAWFVLKNLTVNDTNEYIASISVKVPSDLPYYVRLSVTVKGKEKPKELPPPTPDTTAAAPNNTKKATEEHSPTPDTTAAAPNITPPPKPNSSNILRHIEGYMICYMIGYMMAIALVMRHS